MPISILFKAKIVADLDLETDLEITSARNILIFMEACSFNERDSARDMKAQLKHFPQLGRQSISLYKEKASEIVGSIRSLSQIFLTHILNPDLWMNRIYVINWYRIYFLISKIFIIICSALTTKTLFY